MWEKLSSNLGGGSQEAAIVAGGVGEPNRAKDIRVRLTWAPHWCPSKSTWCPCRDSWLGPRTVLGATGCPGEGGGEVQGTAEGWHGGKVGSMGGPGHWDCGRVSCWRGRYGVSIAAERQHHLGMGQRG